MGYFLSISIVLCVMIHVLTTAAPLALLALFAIGCQFIALVIHIRKEGHL